ncbi:peptidoglycan/xylan/chitin deacetylase (PgdA/CDA1 family) [Streptomyces sp. TLI_235]|nr:polysaccharide deacetylase family protein [Streptomyces sp. TLI_235]PBC70891.1 peptidoglycan/xylan/chitin deacetylase (PgdA/CDA1 family) [Streptomyces sp. TLI_235]
MKSGLSGCHSRIGQALWAGLAVVLTACATAPSRTAAPPATPAPAALPPLAAVEPREHHEPQRIDPLVAAQQSAERQAREKAGRWGLVRLPAVAPHPPEQRPVLTAGQSGVALRAGLPPVVQRVPTEDRVVFLTIDDGAEKDPEFARMTAELGIPYSTFLTGYLARPNWGYFRGLLENGHAAVGNHTLNHRDMRRLSPAEQRTEICGQQDELARETGSRPPLFRPPYGEYTDDTLRAAQECGIRAVALWNEEAFPDRMEYRYTDHVLHPGDTILTHFRGRAEWAGTMTDVLRRVLRTVDEQGFALALLDDYL